MKFLGDLAKTLPHLPLTLALGPIPSQMEKKAGKFRAQLLLSSSHRKALHQLISNCITLITDAPPNRRVRWSIDVDPIDTI